MEAPKIPPNDIQRLAALTALDILDSESEERYDRITRLAQRHFRVAIALVSLVDNDRQWFKSRQGLDATETARDISFCGHAILSDDIFYVSDTQKDNRFFDNPLVVGPPDIRSYAGAPLHSPEGERVGTLCIIDKVAKDYTNEELSFLRDLADIVEIELSRSHLIKLQAVFNESEESLIRFAKRLSLATKAGGIGIWELELETNTLSWDDKMYPLYGVNAEQVSDIYDYWQQSIYRDDLNGYQLAFNNAVKSANSFDREFRIVWPDNQIRHIKTSAVFVFEQEKTLPRVIGVSQDITEIKKMQLAAKLHQSIIQSSEDAIMSKDLNGIVTSWNKAAENIFGYTSEEIIGRPMLQLFPVGREEEEERILKRINQGEKVEHFETVRQTKSGAKIDISVTISPIFDDQGKVVGASKIARDISERKNLELLKSQFVSTVSHEIRTPLTSIRGALSLVIGKSSKDIPEKAANLLKIALRNSDRLNFLINDILDLEKLDANLLEFRFQTIDLVALAKQAIEDMTGFAEQHKIKLVLQSELSAALVHIDQHRLLQVFANLLSNAVKFSPAMAEVKVSVTDIDSGYRVAIEDSGAGIPLDFRSRIFTRFAQADNSDTRQTGGSGLGLSICKVIVERHNGKIGYQSKVGEGSLFYFELPKPENDA